MPHNTEFQVMDPVIIKPPHPGMHQHILGRVVHIEINEDKISYGILHYTMFFKKLQVINVPADRVQKSPEECPSYYTALAHIEDIAKAKEKDGRK